MNIILSPHADDAELGCGGTIHKLVSSGYECLNVVFTCSDITRRKEAEAAANFLGMGLEVLTFKDCELDTYPIKEIVTYLDTLFKKHKVECVYIPYPSFHQDHEIVYKAAITSLRPYASHSNIDKILLYEPPYTYWGPKPQGSPVYVPLTEDNIKGKQQAMKYHASQVSSNQYDLRNLDVIKEWAILRGREISTPFAEKFYLVRSIEQW